MTATWAVKLVQQAAINFCLSISTMLKAQRTSPSMVSEILAASDFCYVKFDIFCSPFNPDELISKLYNTIASKHENVTAIYTARRPSFVRTFSTSAYSFNLIFPFKKVYPTTLIRDVRETSGITEVRLVARTAESKKNQKPPFNSTQVVMQDPHFLLALNNVTVNKTNIDVETLELTVNETTFPTTNLDVSLSSIDFNLQMKFELSGGTWTVTRFLHNNLSFRPHSPVSAYPNRSFGCANLRLSHAKYEIVLIDIQMQPSFNESFNEFNATFSSHNDCVGFFSPAIAGALFVVMILLSILACGITMILDIRPIDRFDDPKSKPINFSAQE